MVGNSTEGGAGAGAVMRRLTSEGESPRLGGEIRRVDGHRMVVELEQAPGKEAVAAGDLVEIAGQRLLSLGQVRAIRGVNVTVLVEHSVAVESLDSIQRVWNRPRQGGGN